MKIVVYICSLVVALLCIALIFEFGARQLLPDSYRGYLVEVDGDQVKWALGPFAPAEPAAGFNPPVSVNKPDDTLRIVVVGDSGTEGWLSAKVVFNKYGQPWESKDISSYARATEFVANSIAAESSRNVEVINLGIAAYNITDVIRMLKDSVRLAPDLFVIQIGGNETWTAARHNWASYISDDIPYLYTALSYEILSDAQSGWETLSTDGNAFNPKALFRSRPQPIVLEPLGRAEGLEERLATFEIELYRLGAYLREKNIPALFLLPSQNLADYQPFGSMARPGTSSEQLEELNELLIAALADPGPDAKANYLEILAIDDGIAEANFQLGRIYLDEGKTPEARELFWKANNRDVVLKRLPRGFREISLEFLYDSGFPYIDTMALFESTGEAGVVGYEVLDDDVHPNRQSQFDLGSAIVTKVVRENLVPADDYAGDLNALPEIGDYNAWTGFDSDSTETIAYLKAAHNFLTFGRYRQRLSWDPNPKSLIAPILDDLAVANRNYRIDEALYLSIVLNEFLGRENTAADVVRNAGCSASPDRGTAVHSGVMTVAFTIFGNKNQELKQSLRKLLNSNGCVK